MRRVRLGWKLRLVVASAAVLLAAGGIVAAVTQDGARRPAGESRADVRASLDGLDSGAAAEADDGGDAAVAGNMSAMASAAGGGSSRGPATTVAPSPDAVLPQASPGDPNGPRIVKRADVRIEVKDDGFRAAFERASSVASAHGGFVAGSTSQTDHGEDERSASGTLVLRVPARAFDAVRAELAGLGEVRSEVIDGEDVGGQLIDLDARIRSLQVEEETLRTLMTRAKTVGETIEVQQQLTRVRQEIEQAAGQRARLQDAAALGTIRANLFEPGAAQAEAPGDPNPVAEGARDAVRASLAVMGGTLLVLGYVLPLALLVLLGWALWRAVARRGHEPAVT
ncbi:MAG TPA: DUF4349 domain-containing protein [Acidimicrobiales bacterium]|nr:DUF4349 domain-containing protein [Acidimicrobiales bacterium]